MGNNWNIELAEYIKEGEPDKVVKTKAWETAIGLQDVDGLKTSKYLIETAKEHIEGNIDIKEVISRINNYYQALDDRKKTERETEEADKVSARITELLSESSFNFNPTELSTIHKRLFDGIYSKAGVYRDYNFTKEEWVLNGDTVIYSDFGNIRAALEYDFKQEKNFSYKNMSVDEMVEHLSKFISNIWQIHPFCEGNTRTTAVFLIKYLKTFGFDVNDEVFKDNSWYFRNSLVRANYKKFDQNIFEDFSFLNKFFYNLLTNSKFKLKNRYTHVNYNKVSSEIKEKKNFNILKQTIINSIRNNPTITQEEIATLINKSVRTVKTYMNDMQEEGIIERINGKRDGSWIIKNNNNS